MVSQVSATTATKEVAARVVKQAKAEHIHMSEALLRFKDELGRDPSDAEESFFAQLWTGKSEGHGTAKLFAAGFLGAALGKWASK